MPTSARSSTMRLVALGAFEIEMRFQRFADLKADGEAGIERRHRLLEDHRHVFAGDAPPLVRAHRREIRAVEGHAVGGHGRGRRQEAHRRQHRHRLAGAGFADDRQHFVALERQVEPVHRRERAVACRERDGEIADFEQRRRHQPLRIFGSSASRRPSPVRLMARTVMRMAKPGRATIQGSELNEFARVGQHRAPFRRRRLGAKAKEAKRRRLENGARHAKRRLHDERSEAVRQHGRSSEPERPDADHARGGHIVLVQFAERGRARETHVGRQIDDRHRDDGVGEAWPQHRNDEHGEHQARHRHDQIHEPRDGDVEDRAGHRRNEPERHADDERHAHHREADEQRHPRAEDEARQHVVAVAVGSEHEAPGAACLPYWRRPHRVAELLDRRMGRNDIGRERQENDDGEDGEAEHRAAVFPERGPERRERRRLRKDGRRLVANRSCQRGDVSGHG